MSDKKRNLSYSGYSTYVTCAKKYDYQYNEKIKPDSLPFHLVFGGAVDKALNEFVVSSDKDKALYEAAKDLFRLFKEKILFDSSDYDGELLTDLTSQTMFYKLSRIGWKGDNPSALADLLFNNIVMGEPISKNQYKALKYLVYFSSLEKISLIIDAFNDYVTPRIEKVISVQQYVKRGIMDFQAELKGVNGPVICDNKTASRDYPLDAVLNSVQLAAYCAENNAENAAYIVFNKTVKKNRTKECLKCKKNGTGKRHKTCDATIDDARCNGEWLETVTPEIVPQIIIDKIPEHNRLMVEEAFQNVETLIEQKVFPRNLNNCGQQYGKPCPFINLCWKSDMSGLKKEEKK